MRLLLTLAIALTALASPASAAEPYGQLTLVQERRAGFLEEVPRSNRHVSVERGGQRLAAERGMAIQAGDILRTERGACVVTTPDGWSVTVGEDSELEVQTTWKQRLGTAIYKVRATFGVRVEQVEVLVEGTIFAVTFDGQNGSVSVVEGVVRVRGDGAETVLRAGQTATFTAAGGVGEADGMSASARRSLARQGKRIGTANAGRASRADRLRVGLGLGHAEAQDRSWFSVALRARVRLAGPVWFAASGGALARPVSADDRRLTLAFPTSLGVRWLGDLPGGFTASLGGSFDALLGERCIEPIECERVVAAEPGGTVDVGLGALLGRRLSLSVEARLGAGLRHEYGEVFRTDAVPVIAPRLDVQAWLEVRL